MKAKDALSAITGYTVGVGMILLFDRPITRWGAMVLLVASYAVLVGVVIASWKSMWRRL
jgi:hypothetical protein